ncbi:MAG TPA: zinc-binding alcohol dehydrogenase family protein [Polyangiaceae bacterium]|nr:zinc-binding alcohol dehydrogenase family protein [Polyangiaceae bacterium]
MKAVALTRYLPISEPESLMDVELEKPQPGPRDLLVRVQAVGVNPVDCKVRAPKPKIENAPRVLGWDAAGVVESVGAEVTLFRAGDAVYYAGDITRPGTNQQFHCVDERIVGHKPRTLDFAEAAALPLTAITAYEALFERLALDIDGADAGSSLLIIGAAGGVGSIAIQLAKLAGLRVVATASRESSRSWVKSLGADEVIDHTRELRDELTRIGVSEVDAIAVFSDTDRYFPALPALIKAQGRITSIVETSRHVDLELLKSKSLTFVWEFMFTRSMHRTPDMIEQHRLLDRVAELVDSGKLRSTLTERLSPIDAASLRRAHAALESGHTIGKIAVEGWR